MAQHQTKQRRISFIFYFHYCFRLFFCCLTSVAMAQGVHPGKSGQTERSDPAGSTEESHLRELGDTVALLPWSYRNGKEAAIQTARESCNHLLLETGFNVFLIKSPSGAMPPAMSGTSQRKNQEPVYAPLLNRGRAIIGQYATDKSGIPYVLPTPDQMLEIGAKLQTRYVLAGRAQWTSRNVWIGVSNRIKSVCTVDLLIMDMESKHLVLEAHDIIGDSTEKQNVFATVTSAIAMNPLPLLFPGSVTPQEQRAVIIATARALAPWLKTERVRAALIQADLSSTPAYSDVSSSVKFSAMLRRIHDLHVQMRITAQDEKLAAGMDSDVARLYAVHDVSLAYTEPSKLTLQAILPKGTIQTLVVTADTRRFDSSAQKTGMSQDIYESPNRHLSLMEFCGLITPGIFEYTRARFVKQEKLNGINTVIYDLSYWGVEDSYYRVWIDTAAGLIVKREWFDHNGQLRATYFYKSPTEIAPHIWIPSRVEVENGKHKQVATITLTNARINQ